MAMSILSFLSFVPFRLGRNKPSANVAKQRLQRVLAAEHSPRSAQRPDYFPALQREMAGVVSKYAKVQNIRLRLERERDSEVIRVKIELRQARV